MAKPTWQGGQGSGMVSVVLSATTYEFDPTTKKWQEVPGGELPKGIKGAISFTLNGKAYLAGGG